MKLPVPVMPLQDEVSQQIDPFVWGAATARALATATCLLLEGLLVAKVAKAELIAAPKVPAANHPLLSRLAGIGRRLLSGFHVFELLLAESRPPR